MEQCSIIHANNHAVDATLFRAALIEWGRLNFRQFPWRMTEDPYCILMAEVMLHRTQARQVVPIYERFLRQYPNIVSLAQAERTHLHETLYSLGLRWRIDLIHDMSRHLVTHFGGRVPMAKEDLLSLPGVSDYIASAVRCFAWNLPEALIDTNTVRVIGRLFGLEIRDSSRRNSLFRRLIRELVDPDHPRVYNYALLDLGDRVCTKRHAPAHTECPVLLVCHSGLSHATVQGGSATTWPNETRF